MYPEKNIPNSFFSWVTIMFQECTKWMQVVIIPCSEEIVCKTHNTVWVPSAQSADLEGIFQRHQAGTEKVLWHNIRGGVCSLSLNIVMFVKKKKQPNKLVLVCCYWKIDQNFTESLKTSLSSKLLFKVKLFSKLDKVDKTLGKFWTCPRMEIPKPLVEACSNG